MASRNPIDSPVVAIPPLRPEAPKATVSRSKTATLAPLRARCRAADSPVSPAPTTATSTWPPISVEDRSGPGAERVEPVRRELHVIPLLVRPRSAEAEVGGEDVRSSGWGWKFSTSDRVPQTAASWSEEDAGGLLCSFAAISW